MPINTSCLEALKIDFSTCRAAGVNYVVTTDTGEGTFAYLASEINEESLRFDAMTDKEQDAYDYSEHFCNAVSPEDSREVAIAILVMGDYEIFEGGTAVRVLDDDDVETIHAAIAAYKRGRD
jgi:hypothetical protein